MEDSQLLVELEGYTMQVECIFMIPDIFVYSPCDKQDLRYFFALLVISAAHLSSSCSLFTLSTNIFLLH